MRQTTRLAPAGKPHDGQALYLSQEQAAEEEGENEIKSILEHNFLNKHLHSADIVGSGSR